MRTVALVVLIAVLVAVVIGMCNVGVNVQLRQQRRLVGPSEEVIEMLFQDRPSDEIMAAVERAGKHVDDIRFLGVALLQEVVARDRGDLAEWLLRKGANPNGVPHHSPLDQAVLSRSSAMVCLLLDAGADPNLDIGHGYTPLRVAEERGYEEIVALLKGGRDAMRGRGKGGMATCPTTGERERKDDPGAR